MELDDECRQADLCHLCCVAPSAGSADSSVSRPHHNHSQLELETNLHEVLQSLRWPFLGIIREWRLYANQPALMIFEAVIQFHVSLPWV